MDKKNNHDRREPEAKNNFTHALMEGDCIKKMIMYPKKDDMITKKNSNMKKILMTRKSMDYQWET